MAVVISRAGNICNTPAASMVIMYIIDCFLGEKMRSSKKCSRPARNISFTNPSGQENMAVRDHDLIQLLIASAMSTLIEFASCSQYWPAPFDLVPRLRL